MKAFKTFVFIMVILSLSIGLTGKVVTLKELNRPQGLLINNGQLLIVEFPTIHIYSLADFKYVTKFGKKGEGPQEFLRRARLHHHSEHIAVSSKNKLSFYSSNGEFIKEIRPKSKAAVVAEYKPLGDNFAVYGEGVDDKVTYISLDLYDSNLKKIKELRRWKRVHQLGRGFDPVDTDMKGGEFRIYDNKVFLLLRSEGKIEVFDKDGKKLYDINHPFERLPITQKVKDGFHHYLKTAPRHRQVYDRIKHEIKFQDKFPAAQRTDVTNGKIYVTTFKRTKDKREIVVFDLKGKHLKTIMVPFKDANIRKPYPYTIHDGKLYQIIENSDDEEWELHIREIK